MTSPATFYATEPTGSQAYGAPRDGGKRSHTGDDFSHSTRANTIDVPAIRAGVVVDVQHDSPNLGNGYGNQVYVLHADRSMFSYGHLGRIAVAEGQTVEAGTIVGTEGTTGWTDGPCVHIEFFDARGLRLDPYPHIRAALGRPAMSAGDSTPTTNTDPQEDEMKTLLINVKMDDGTEPWFFVNYTEGTVVRAQNGLQLDIARNYAGVVQVSGLQGHDAIRGLRTLVA